jgi:hypothetical protein
MALPTVTISEHLLEADGVTAYRRGIVRARLSQAGRALDGAEVVAVSGGDLAMVGIGGAVSLHLVPNDVISPSGTVYLVEKMLCDSQGHWDRFVERWSVASSGEATLVSDPVARFVAGPRGPAGPSGLSGI